MTARYLPEETMQSLRKVFGEVDEDGSGLLSLDELQEALRRVGAVMSSDDVRSVFAFVDLDASGHIDCTEFAAAAMSVRIGECTAEIRRAFEELDSDQSGSIEVAEFVDVCLKHNMGERDEIQALVEGALVDAVSSLRAPAMWLLHSTAIGPYIWKLSRLLGLTLLGSPCAGGLGCGEGYNLGQLCEWWRVESVQPLAWT